MLILFKDFLNVANEEKFAIRLRLHHYILLWYHNIINESFSEIFVNF